MFGIRAKGIEVTLPGLENDTVDGLSRVENNIFGIAFHFISMFCCCCYYSLLFKCCIKIACNVFFASLSLCVVAAVKATGVPNIFLCKFPDNLSKVKGKSVTVEVLRVLQWAETKVDFIDLTACLGKTIISCFTELNCKFT